MSQLGEFFQILQLAAPFVSVPSPEYQHSIQSDRKRLKGQVLVTCTLEFNSSSSVVEGVQCCRERSVSCVEGNHNKEVLVVAKKNCGPMNPSSHSDGDDTLLGSSGAD